LEDSQHFLKNTGENRPRMVIWIYVNARGILLAEKEEGAVLLLLSPLIVAKKRIGSWWRGLFGMP
jgi:hypothetical protein